MAGGPAAPGGGPIRPLGAPIPPAPPGVHVPTPTSLPPTSTGSSIVRHIVTVVVALLVIGGIGYIGLIRPMMEERQWVEGACIDYYPVSSVEQGIDPSIVACSDDRARARIVGVVGPDATIERDCEPLGSFALVAREKRSFSKEAAKYCIVEIEP